MPNISKKIGIIGAMDVEVKTLKGLMKPFEGENELKITEAGSLTFTEGVLEGVNVVVVQSGIGKVNAALCAQRLVLQFGVTHIINTGIAGAAGAGLGVLDFVVSTDAIYHDFDVRGFGYDICVIPQMDCSDFAADEKMIAAAEKAFSQLEEAKGHKLVKGRIASGDQFISSSEQKNTIKVNCAPACVEMEGAAIAHACYINKIPFVIIRCMSDMAEDSSEKTYDFNEELAADLSAKLVLKMINF